MKLAPLLASSLFLAFSAMLAQQPSPKEKEPPPEPPLMGSAPAECQWTITYASRTPPDKEATTPEAIQNRNLRLFYSPTILSKHIYKAPGQMAIFTTYEAGIKTEAWVIGGFIHELPFRAGQAIKFDEKKTSDFSEINWVTADNFRGTVELKGAQVHLYQVPDPTPSDSAAPSASPASPAAAATKVTPKRAYIDATTRLPVVVDFGNAVATYQYSGPAANFPVPDERIKKLMQENGGTKKK